MPEMSYEIAREEQNQERSIIYHLVLH